MSTHGLASHTGTTSHYSANVTLQQSNIHIPLARRTLLPHRLLHLPWHGLHGGCVRSRIRPSTGEAEQASQCAWGERRSKVQLSIDYYLAG